MADRKKQHYVPKFYLKFFSDNGIHINAFHIKDKSVLQNIPYESQVSENYFYGNDLKMEKAFGTLESKINKILKKIIVDEKLPSKKTIDRTELLFFCVIQSARTKLAGDLHNEQIDTLYKKIFSYQMPDYDKHLFIRCKLPANNVILNTILGFGVVTEDMECKLLINKTPVPFIASDNPTIKYNQYMIRSKHPSPQMGLASKGLQIICPFSPKLAVFFYDLNVYKIGDKKKSEVVINNEKDIEYLNALTIINANEVIFFNQMLHFGQVNNMVCKYAKFQLDISRTKIDEIYREKDVKEERVILRCSRKSPHFYPNFSFVKETDKAKHIVNTELVLLRNDKLKNEVYRKKLCEKYLPYPFIEELMK